jgi:hypothetical protein
LEAIHLLWVLSRPNTLILAVSMFGVFAHSIMIASVQSPCTSYIYLLFLPPPPPPFFLHLILACYTPVFLCLHLFLPLVSRI